jgi:hypothetical protein
MPYKVRGRTVYVQKRNGKWVILKRHATAKKAKAHAYALKKNVGEA